MYKPKSRLPQRCSCTPKCIDKCIRYKNLNSFTNVENINSSIPELTIGRTQPPIATPITAVMDKDMYVLSEENVAVTNVSVDAAVAAAVNMAAANAILVNEAAKNVKVIGDMLPAIKTASEKIKKFQSEYTINSQGKIVINAPIDMKNQCIHNVKSPESESDAVNKLYLHAVLDRQLDGKQRTISNVANPEVDSDAANKRYVDSRKKKHYLFSNAYVDGLNTKYFNPAVCLEKCTLKYIQWNTISASEGKFYVHSKSLNNASSFEKKELGKKTKSGDMYEFPINMHIDSKTQIFFSCDFAADSSNIILCYEN